VERDGDQETDFDFRLPGGTMRLVDAVLDEIGDDPPPPAPAPANAPPPPPKKKPMPESREQPTMLIDAQQVALDHAVASSMKTSAHPLPPPDAPPPAEASPPATEDAPLELEVVEKPRVIRGKPERPPPAAEAPVRKASWLPVIILAALVLSFVIYRIIS
jgi:hypothetical protein